MTNIDFITEIQSRLSNQESFDNPLLGYKRASPEEARKLQPPPKESAVMFLLYHKNDTWFTIFMKRPVGQGVHSNQISFPGGKVEDEESLEDAARRETMEEVGVHPTEIEIIGRLNDVYIPPSHFLVAPFIGRHIGEPKFIANPTEVAEIIEFPIHQLFQENLIKEKEIFIPVYQRKIMAKYFDIHGHTLWGATAMMIQEFRQLFGYHT